MDQMPAAKTGSKVSPHEAVERRSPRPGCKRSVCRLESTQLISPPFTETKTGGRSGSIGNNQANATMVNLDWISIAGALK